jgi:bifunctional UDP-N-acetylglucosamine pyrophosphorylase/glucosamine-1-phosphate N-acetyltransferase
VTPEYYFNAEILFKPVSEWLRAGFFAGSGINAGGFPVLLLDGREYAVDSPAALSAARKAAQRAVNLMFMGMGADIYDIETVYIHPDTLIGKGTVVYPNTVIREDVRIGSDCKIGPFAYLRPGTRVGDGVKLGDFVEVKNSVIGARTSVSHLTYIGDSDVGQGVNFGCGAVTVNYDGASKARTAVGDGAFIGCNTNLVAPVSVGEGAYTAAGSTITDDVPPGALALARQRQVNKENWTAPRDRG